LSKDNKIITLDERKAIKELSELLDEHNLSQIQIENEKLGKIKVSKHSIESKYFEDKSEIKNEFLDKTNEINESVIENDNVLKSPMVGTVYLQPEPEAEAFIKMGDKVKKGQILLIVEAMKTMNDIIAEKDGKIKEILVKNEQPVQFDEPLLIFE